MDCSSLGLDFGLKTFIFVYFGVKRVKFGQLIGQNIIWLLPLGLFRGWVRDKLLWVVWEDAQLMHEITDDL